jgi:hypothetical protein
MRRLSVIHYLKMRLGKMIWLVVLLPFSAVAMVSDDVTAEISADASAPKAEPASAGLRRRHLKPSSQPDDHTQLLPKPEDSESDTDSSSSSKTSLVGKIWRRFFSRHATSTSTKHPSRTSSSREDTSVAEPARALSQLMLFGTYHPMTALGVMVPRDEAQNLEIWQIFTDRFDPSEIRPAGISRSPVVMTFTNNLAVECFTEVTAESNAEIKSLGRRFNPQCTHAILFNILGEEPVIFFTFTFLHTYDGKVLLKRVIVGFTIDSITKQSKLFVKILGNVDPVTRVYYQILSATLTPDDPRLSQGAAMVRKGSSIEFACDQMDDLAIAAKIYPGNWPIHVQVGIIDKKTLLQKRADAGVALPEELVELAALSAPLATAVVDTATTVSS